LIKEMQALCLNVDVLSATGEAVQVRDLSDEDGYRAAEELGIDLSRAERASADLEGR
jgi:DNA-directed RNA polymerase subunit beta